MSQPVDTPIATPSSKDTTSTGDAIANPKHLQTCLTENIYLLSGQVAILCQFAHPALAKGSYNHSNFARRIPNRLENTMRFMTAAAYGTREEKDAVFSIIHRYHARVKGDDYDANDPELHKWTAATLFVSFVWVHTAFFGELPQDRLEALFREFAVFGTSLRMPLEMWPATLDEFWAYWDHNIATLEVTDMARKLSRDLLYPVELPLWMRLTMPLGRLVTVHLLPERLAREYDLEPTMLSRLRYQATVNALSVAYPLLPLSMRQTLHHQSREDLRKAVSRIKSTGHWA